MNKLKTFVIIAFTSFSILILPFSASHAQLSASEKALCTSVKGNTISADEKQCLSPGKQLAGDSANTYLVTFTNLLLYLAGAISVIVSIFGGIRYATSTVDAMRIKQAKDTILYGIVGLVVALMAFGIVNSLVNQLGAPV